MFFLLSFKRGFEREGFFYEFWVSVNVNAICAICIASLTALEDGHTNCRESIRCCVTDSIYIFTSCSNHFITSDISAFAWKLFNIEGLGSFATGISFRCFS